MMRTMLSSTRQWFGHLLLVRLQRHNDPYNAHSHISPKYEFKISLNIYFSNFVFASEYLPTNVPIRRNICLLINFESSMNSFDLVTVVQHPSSKNEMYNNILFRMKVVNNLLFWRCLVDTSRDSVNPKAPICLCMGKQNSLPSHVAPLVFHRQFWKTILAVYSPQHWQCRGNLDHKDCPAICNSETANCILTLPTGKWSSYPGKPLSVFTGALFSWVGFQDTILVENRTSPHGSLNE